MSYPFDYFRVQNDGSLVPTNKKDVEKKQEDFFDVMEWRIKHDRSNIIINVGEQGSGKSNTGLYLIDKCNEIFYNKKTDFDLHVYNSILDFVRNFSKLKDCYVLLEEVGVELNSRDWRSATNKVFRDVIETFRIRHINLVLTLPNLMDLDKSTRFLSHYIVKMNYPSNALIFRKLTSFLTDKIRFMPVWTWCDIPNMREYNKDLWNKYEEFHEDYIDKKNDDWLEEIELKTMERDYRINWYKQRTKQKSSIVRLNNQNLDLKKIRHIDKK